MLSKTVKALIKTNSGMLIVRLLADRIERIHANPCHILPLHGQHDVDLTGSYLCGIVQVSPNQIFREGGDADTPEHTWSESAEANRVCLSDLCLSYKAIAQR